MRIVKTFNYGVAWEEGSGISQGYSINGTIYVSGQFSQRYRSHELTNAVLADE